MKRIVISTEELETIRKGALNEIDRLTSKLRDTMNSYFLRFKTEDVHTWSMYRGNPAHTGTAGPTHDMIEGKLKFSYRVGPNIKTSPIVTPQHIFTAANGGNEFHCISLESGELVWKSVFDSRVTSPAATSWDGFVFVPCDDQQLYSIGIESGLIRWKFHMDDIVLNTPCVDGTNVFLTSREGYLIALDGSHCQLKWISPWESAFSEPSAGEVNIFIGTYDGCLMSVWQGSGDIKWKTKSLGKATSSAAYYDKRVFYSLPESDKSRGYLYALDAQSAKILWRYETIASITCSSAIAKDCIYIVVQNYLESLTVADAQKRWRFGTETPIRSCPTVIDDAVFIVTKAGVVHAVDVNTGKEIWNKELGGGVVGSSAYGNGALVVSCEDGLLYAFC
ncbi:PQQ-like beta-propeller repeat protein [bacterium]|nr:PQQ-like beta-propeller repeat protein [bacterium]